MIAAVQSHDVWSQPTAVICLVAAAGIAAWAVLHLLQARVGRGPGTWQRNALLLLVRVGVGFGTCLAVAQVLMRVLVLATNWPIWPIALGGAVVVEVLLLLYNLERQTVSRRAGMGLAALRVALVLLVVVMLTQPVRSLELQHKLKRFVAVLLDDSASMHLADRQLTPSEKLRLGEMLSIVDSQRPSRLDAAWQQLERVRQKLTEEGDRLQGIKEPDRPRQLAARRKEMSELLTKARETVAGQAGAIGAALAGKVGMDQRTRDLLNDAKGKLDAYVRERIGAAARIVEETDGAKLAQQYAALLDAVLRAATALKEVNPRLSEAAGKLDTAFYDSLSAERRQKIDAVGLRARFDLAREVLLHKPVTDFAAGKTDPSLLEKLQENYDVRIYKFASAPSDVSAADLENAPQTPASTQPASQPAERQQTDLAASMEKVMTDIPVSQLAGVILLSDGRHNAAKRPEELAGKLGLQGVPVCSVVMGGEKAPCDAAVMSVDSPDTVYAKDKIYVSADVKLDGLAGKSVRMTLFDGEKQVDTRTVIVPEKEDRFRTKVQLSDEPKDVGAHNYKLVVDSFEGEVFANNNEYPFTVSVTEDKTKLLVVEGRPRWEFRYLKNLFADRDLSVKLQYVLLQPDQIAGRTERPKVPASATRPAIEVEATSLPGDAREPMKDEDVVKEWMKFDVVILGDVDPNALRPVDAEALRKFVVDRGGTLIVIAGAWHMPHNYVDSNLANLLPVTFKPLVRSLAPEGKAAPVPAAPEMSFRIALTAEGRESVIMRQAVDRDENLRIWNSMSEIYWRYPIEEAKPGASVLAYALPPSPPKFMEPSSAPGEASDDELAQRRREFERKNALIITQNVPMGQVMFLSFDRTWRMRYREGDTYHHKFWGQVLRWATAGKLPAGTDFVKLGTDRARYPAHANITVRAKVVKQDFSPVVSEQMAVKVSSGQQLVLRRKLRYLPGSPGMYSSEIGELPTGTYRVELDSPDASAVLAADKTANVQKVWTEFSVDPYTPAEQVQLDADRGLPSRLASLTGGVVVEPAQAQEVQSALGPGTQVLRERQQYVIWDSWPLLVLIVLLATVEWLTRKKVGLP